MLKRKPKAQPQNEVPAATIGTPDDFDVSELLTAAVVTPTVGVVKTKLGQVIPRVFVKVHSIDKEGQTFEHTYSFDSADLAAISNVLNAISIGLLVAPESVNGLLDEGPTATPGNGGYL